MLGFAVNDHGEVFAAKLGRALPDLLDKRTRRVVLLHVHPEIAHALLEFDRGPKGRHDDHIVGRQRVQRHELLAEGIVQELHAAALEVGVDFGVVNHLTEQENPLARVLIHGLVADLDGVFHPKTEPKMTRQTDAHCTKVQLGRREVLFPGIQGFAFGLHPGNDGAAVKIGDVEAAHVAQKYLTPSQPFQEGKRSFHQVLRNNSH